jgi:hypothetical protein
MIFYPITKAKHRRILKGLEEHHKGHDAEDPLTGKILRAPKTIPEEERKRRWLLLSFAHWELGMALKGGLWALLLVCCSLGMVWLGIAAGSAVLWVKFPDYYYVWGYACILGVCFAAYHGVRCRTVVTLRRLDVTPQNIRDYLASPSL